MLKLKTICKTIVGTSVNVFSQSQHDIFRKNHAIVWYKISPTGYQT